MKTDVYLSADGKEIDSDTVRVFRSVAQSSDLNKMSEWTLEEIGEVRGRA